MVGVEINPPPRVKNPWLHKNKPVKTGKITKYCSGSNGYTGLPADVSLGFIGRDGNRTSAAGLPQGRGALFGT